MSKQKKIVDTIRITIEAGKASAAPPVGPALGRRKVNIMDFCKKFNDATSGYDAGAPIPTIITVYSDSSYTFITKKPTVTYMLKNAANIKKGSSLTRKEPYISTITAEQCRNIAKEKISDMNAYDVEAAFKIVKGSAESMGIQVLDDSE